MKKYLMTALLTLCLSATAFADQRTTILTEATTLRGAQVSLPVIDGSNNTVLEQNANKLLRDGADALAAQVGGQVSYEVLLNRPSLISVLLKANNNGRQASNGFNIDLTSGKEFEVKDFFLANDDMKAKLGDYTKVLFAEQGLQVQREAGTEFVPYTAVLANMRIGEAGRIMQIARLTKQAAGKTVTLEEPGLVALKLDSNPSTGYGWELGNESSKMKLVGKSFNMPAADDKRVGTPGEEIIFVAFTEPGTYDCKMVYKRAWEKIKLQEINFKVIVK